MGKRELELIFRTSGSLFNKIAFKRSALILADLGPDSALAVSPPEKKLKNQFNLEINVTVKE
jgi:hypothetical protein